MTTLPIEQRIPGTVLYGAPEECRDTLSRPLRCMTDPRWRWPDEPPPLPLWTRRAIDLALICLYRRMCWYTRMRREMGGTR